MVEAVSIMLRKAKWHWLLIGFDMEHLNIDITHLVFANDTIIFCDVNVEQVDKLKMILLWFELFSGLKINYRKCEIMGVCWEQAEVFSCG